MRVLILGGTTEASAIARALAGDARYAPVLSLAGRTRAPVAPPIPWRIGGFGGAAGLADYLRAERIAAVIDATHPFAARMKGHAIEAASIAGIPHLAVLRPPWMAQPGDQWTLVPTMHAAAAALGGEPRRVFLTVGQGELAPFGPPHRYLLRSVDAPPNPPPGATVITARGPFTAEADRALMLEHGIDTLVTKNSGGVAVEGKVAAARALGIAVIMVARPDPPAAPTVPDAAGALHWLHAQAALRGV
jgi:precorrin-6A/cobalt-precorrin-6A reductase